MRPLGRVLMWIVGPMVAVAFGFYVMFSMEEEVRAQSVIAEKRAQRAVAILRANQDTMKADLDSLKWAVTRVEAEVHE